MALWWLSFLRPPPVSATTHVEIIVQITDDLRTKFYPGTIDIYSVWSSESLDHSTNPTKLMTWRSEHAHKLLCIRSPPVRGGTSASAITWRLGLFTLSPDNKHPSTDICFTGRNLLRDILPVYSAPIAWSSPPIPVAVIPTAGRSTKRPKAKAINTQKQDEIQRVFKLPVFPAGISQETPIENGSDPVIIVEKTSFDLDKRAWDSGIVLGAVLSRWLSSSTTQPFKTAYSSSLGDNHVGTQALQSTLRVIARPGSTILELGSGCGVVSVILATLLSRLHAWTAWTAVRPSTSSPSPKPTQIHATDLESAIPLIKRNIEANCRLPSPGSETSENPSVETIAYTLNWEDEELPSNVASSPPDVIMMSDVTYNTASFPALLKTVKNLLSLSPAACVIIAYKERHIAERTAWEMFENDAKLSLHKVEEISGPAGAPVEIWLGSQAL